MRSGRQGSSKAWEMEDKAELELEMRCLNSLAKVFPDESLIGASYKAGSTLHGEAYSFQITPKNKKRIRTRHFLAGIRFFNLSERIAPKWLYVISEHTRP